MDVIGHYTTCDIMVLADLATVILPNHFGAEFWHFSRKRELCGAWMANYQPTSTWNAWVRWYHNMDTITPAGKPQARPVRFLPMSGTTILVFLIANVLRGCHIVPEFTKGKLHLDN